MIRTIFTIFIIWMISTIVTIVLCSLHDETDAEMKRSTKVLLYVFMTLTIGIPIAFMLTYIVAGILFISVEMYR